MTEQDTIVEQVKTLEKWRKHRERKKTEQETIKKTIKIGFLTEFKSQGWKIAGLIIYFTIKMTELYNMS